MPDENTQIKFLTVREANALLPLVQQSLAFLRDLRTSILRTQAQIEIEEMTGSLPDGKLSAQAQTAVARAIGELQVQTGRFEEKLGELFRAGAHLKDLDAGLVDFYSLRDSQTILLCWKEGEKEVGHWHNLQGGFQSRQPL